MVAADRTSSFIAGVLIAHFRTLLYDVYIEISMV